MHAHPRFALTDRARIVALMRANSLATVLWTSPDGLPEAHLLPLEIDDTALGLRLRGHVLRRHRIREQVGEGAILTALFRGPDAYLSPRWFDSGQHSRRVAPSWNYVAVQARGAMRWIDADPGWMSAHLASLTATQEAEQSQPWTLHDADPAFVAQTTAALCGFEVVVATIDGRAFLSQQRTALDRERIVQQLRRSARGTSGDLADWIEMANDDRRGEGGT